MLPLSGGRRVRVLIGGKGDAIIGPGGQARRAASRRRDQRAGAGRRSAMTEAEWLDCTDPVPMLEFIRGKVSDRKLRLFALACARRVLHLLTDKRVKSALGRAELCLEGLAIID